MSVIITAACLFLVLAFIALLHGYWAFGGSWPAKDRASLPQTVVGIEGMTQMPSFSLTMSVALLIFTAGLLPLIHVDLILVPLPDWMIRTGIAGLAGIFFLRGIAGYTPYFTAQHACEPFLTLDKHYYSPLCLTIGTGFSFLFFS